MSLLWGLLCEECDFLRVVRPCADEPKPVVDMHICTVAFDMRSNASRHASAGGHFSIRSPRTEVAARMVKSTSSIVCCCQYLLSLRGDIRGLAWRIGGG